MKKTKWKYSLFFLLFVFGCSVSYAQTIVTGTVTDETGEALPGVSIAIKGGKAGTITDRDGAYQILAPDKNAVLVFSYLGYTAQEEKTGNRTRIDVTLKEYLKVLDEVVVVGYGTMKKRDLSGAVAQIKGDELMKGNPASSVNQALQGKLAGVMVSQNDGAPGGGINISVRGTNSFGSSSQPLYIVDGIPFEAGTQPKGNSMIYEDGAVQPSANALALINPHDIESIEVLKDASATAIYGSRGANGVVLITTKKGKQGKAKVEFASNFSASTIRKQMEMLNPVAYANYRNEQIVNDQKYYGIDYTGLPYNGTWKYTSDAAGNILKGEYSPSPADYLNPGWYYDDSNGNNNGAGLGYKKYIEGTNWQDRIFQTGQTQEYNLQVSGANDNHWYSFSGNYLNQSGIIKKSGYERYTLRTNIGQKINDRVELGVNVNVSKATSDFAKTNNNDVNVLRAALFFDPTIYYGDNSTQEELQDLAYNPYTYVMTAKDQLQSTNIFASAYGELAFTNWLKFRQNLGVSYYANERGYYYNRDTGEGKAPGINGRGGWSDNGGSYMTSESMLTFNKTFNTIHSLNAVVAFTVEESNWKSKSMSATQFPTDLLENYNMGSALSPDALYSAKAKNTLMSMLGRVNYVLMDKYIFTVSFRRDGSSKFKKENKFSNFASGAVAWRVSEEKFIKNLGVFNNLKLRLSFGQTGNQAIGDYTTLPTVQISNYPLNGNLTSGISSDHAVNETLKWETTDQYNAGIDFGFLNNRLNLTVDYYFKKTRDLLQNVKIPLSTGFQDMQRNFGWVTNEGLEISAGYTMNIVGGLNWKIDGNITFNRNRIGGLEKDQFATRLWYSADNAFIQRNGFPIGAIYGYVEDGFYDNEAEVRMDKQYTNVTEATVKGMVGEIKYRDLDGDGYVTSDKDMTIIGNTNPDYVFGITNAFKYKNWDFSFFVQGVEGNNIFNGNLMAVEMLGGLNVPKFAYDDRWATETSASARFPKATNQQLRTWKLSDRYVEDGSYIRLKNINLGYNFRNPFKGISNINLYASATNLLTFTDYSWYDPDVNAFGGDSSRRGIDIYSYPTSRTYSMGIKVEF
jgi:TonB-linked SusC/RagA family outer membrane protein